MLSEEGILKQSSDSERNPPLNLRRYHGKRRARGLVFHSPEDSNDTHKDSEEVLTRLKSREITRRDLRSDSEFEPSSDLVTASPGHGSASSNPILESGKKVRPRKNSRRRKNLKERLYEAAVSTYGYPDPSFMNTTGVKPGDTGSPETRVEPLHFVPAPGTRPERTRSPRRKMLGNSSILESPMPSVPPAFLRRFGLRGLPLTVVQRSS
jgi:hypothetical protein